MSTPFTPFPTDPTAGLAPNLVPTPPAAMPEAPDVPDATARLSPFVQPQDFDSIVAQLTLDRPLPLHIPREILEKYRDFQFHIINDSPQEEAAAQRRGFRRVDVPELVELFEGKVSGSDKTGRITKPVLMARDRRIGLHEAKLKRMKLAELNKGLDPKARTFNAKSAENVTTGPDASKGQFSGMGLGRIRIE